MFFINLNENIPNKIHIVMEINEVNFLINKLKITPHLVHIN